VGLFLESDYKPKDGKAKNGCKPAKSPITYK